VYVAPAMIGGFSHGVARYLPIFIVGNSLSTTRPEGCSASAQCFQPLSAWAGLGVIALYAAVVLGIGGWLFARRDA
jgi:ABC-2 type transport system permease protein